MARVCLWLSHHHKATVELGGRCGRVSLGAPLTGARAAVTPIALCRDGVDAPLLSGCLRASADAEAAVRVSLVFEGRAQSRLARDEAETAAAGMLYALAARIASDDLLESVA